KYTFVARWSHNRATFPLYNGHIYTIFFAYLQLQHAFAYYYSIWRQFKTGQVCVPGHQGMGHAAGSCDLAGVQVRHKPGYDPAVKVLNSPGQKHQQDNNTQTYDKSHLRRQHLVEHEADKENGYTYARK